MLALYGMIWIGGAAVGSVVIGALSEVFGLTKPITTCGVVCIIVFIFSNLKKNKIEDQIVKHQNQE